MPNILQVRLVKYHDILIEEILHHLGWSNPYKQWDVYRCFQLVQDFATINSTINPESFWIFLGILTMRLLSVFVTLVPRQVLLASASDSLRIFDVPWCLLLSARG